MNNVLKSQSIKVIAATGIALSLTFAAISAAALPVGAATVSSKAKSGTATAKSPVYVRASESKSSKILGTLQKGEKVEFIKDNYGWSQVKYKGKTGYVGTQFLNLPGEATSAQKSTSKTTTKQPSKKATSTKAKAATATKQTSRTVTAKSPVYVRASESKKSKILGTLQKGEKVEFIKDNYGWSQVKYKGQTGYVGTQFLNVK
ncbi:SH3 domain-containing protein [Listeria costaricensis]|uniref:SH3 domain-containing protein n=1 Tax=Listeria costaricensis TaxID=2026604 RepID=UPI000C06CE44|nr:SH3 domain-containing protein [Listeria costaricensis]